MKPFPGRDVNTGRSCAGTRWAPYARYFASMEPLRLAVVEVSPRGGLLHYAFQLSNALAERGNEVDLIVPRGNELAAHEGAARMLAVLPPYVSSAPPPRGRLAYQARRVGTGLRLGLAWARVVLETLRGGYDAVILGSDVTLLPGFAGVALMTSVPRHPPLVYVLHNVRPYNRWGGSNMMLTTQRSLASVRGVLLRAAFVIVHGNRSRAELLETWPPVPVVVVPHGDERLFSTTPPLPSSEERVLFFGDWRKVKGIPVLMEAFDELVGRRPAVRLTIAGTPAPVDFDPEFVRQWAQRHGDRVTVVDRYVPVEEVRDLFAAARVVVAPYLVAYQSGVVHLAMTMARPVVATSAGDLPDAVVDGVTGFLVPVGDAMALASALEKVVADPALATRLGAAGHERVTGRSSWRRIAAQLEPALRTVAREGARGARRHIAD